MKTSNAELLEKSLSNKREVAEDPCMNSLEDLMCLPQKLMETESHSKLDDVRLNGEQVIINSDGTLSMVATGSGSQAHFDTDSDTDSDIEISSYAAVETEIPKAIGEKKDRAQVEKLERTKENARRLGYDMVLAASLAVFSVVLAANQMGLAQVSRAQLVQVQEMNVTSLSTNQTQIQENIIEGQRDLIKTIIATNALKREALNTATAINRSLEARLNDIRIHAKESPSLVPSGPSKNLEGASHSFSMAAIFVQCAMIVGGAGLLVSHEKVKNLFLGLMVFFGIIGMITCILAYTSMAGV